MQSAFYPHRYNSLSPTIKQSIRWVQATAPLSVSLHTHYSPSIDIYPRFRERASMATKLSPCFFNHGWSGLNCKHSNLQFCPVPSRRLRSVSCKMRQRNFRYCFIQFVKFLYFFGFARKRIFN